MKILIPNPTAQKEQFICDFCGSSEWAQALNISIGGGYGSKYDLCDAIVNICGKCCQIGRDDLILNKIKEILPKFEMKEIE